MNRNSAQFDAFYGSILAVALAACGNAQVVSGKASSSPTGTTHESACKLLERAKALFANGRLHSADRLLSQCPHSDQARTLRRAVQVALGETTAARETPGDGASGAQLAAETATILRRQQLRELVAPDSLGRTEIDQARSEVLSGKCTQALATAHSNYWRFRPNPQAAILAGRAAACLHDVWDTNRWYARATWELERDGDLHWSVARLGEGGAWLGPNELEIGSYDVDSQIGRFGLVGPVVDWRFGIVKKPVSACPEKIVYANERIDTCVSSKQVVTAIDRHKRNQLWRLVAPSNSPGVIETELALDSTTLLQIWNETSPARVRWRRIDAITGVVSDWRAIGNLESATLKLASPWANWFVVYTVDNTESPNAYFVVSDSGKLKKWIAKDWPMGELLGAWSSDELAVSANGKIEAVNVWTMKRRDIAGMPPELNTACSLARTDDGRNYVAVAASNSRCTGSDIKNFEIECRGGSCSSQLHSVPSLFERLQNARWSQDGKYVIGRLPEMGSHASTWEVATGSLLFRVPSLVKGSDGVAVSPDGRRIAVAGSREIAEFDLTNGAIRIGSPVNTDDNILWYTSMGIGNYFDRTIWTADGKIEPRNWSSNTSDVKSLISGGDWYALRGHGARASCLLNTQGPSFVRADIYAISSDGRYAVTRDEKAGNSANIQVSKLSLNEPRLVPIFAQQVQQPNSVRAIFDRSSTRVFLRIDGIWSDVAISGGDATLVSNGGWLDDALEIWGGGAFVLTPKGVFRRHGSKSNFIAFDPNPSELAKRLSGDIKLALDETVALFPTESGVLLWSTSNGKWLGQLKHVVQGMVFTQDMPSRQGHGLVEIFGDAARENLFCDAGERLYPWEVCADRFESEGLLKEALASNATAH